MDQTARRTVGLVAALTLSVGVMTAGGAVNAAAASRALATCTPDSWAQYDYCKPNERAMGTKSAARRDTNAERTLALCTPDSWAQWEYCKSRNTRSA